MRAGLLALTCGALAATGTGIDPAGAAPGEPTISGDCGESGLAAPDEASAAARAARCGVDVEVLGSRSEWETLYAQADGSMRLDVSSIAVRTKVAGQWTGIDTRLVERGDTIGVIAPAVEMAFSNGVAGVPLVRMVRDGHVLTFDMPFELPAPQINGTTLEYGGVLPGVDLMVSVNDDGTGFSEVLRVASARAAADPRLAELVFPVTVSDGLELVPDDGGFVAQDALGDAVFAAPVPLMWDSSADPASAASLREVPNRRVVAAVEPGSSEVGGGEGHGRETEPRVGDQVVPVPLDLGDGAVEITPDVELLSAPDTVWPVYIDPSVSASLADWTTIADAGWKHYRYAGDDGLGYCNLTSMGCSSIFRSRMMWEYGGLAQIGALTRADVLSATFKAYGTHSYSCTSYNVSAWRVGGFTANTGWPGVWYGSALDTQKVAHRASCGNQRWIEWDVTEALRQIADEDANAVAIGLRDPYETSMAGWKRYEPPRLQWRLGSLALTVVGAGF